MIPDTSFLLIGTLATKANTTKDTVRHYDELGLLKSRKRQAGSRLYTEFHPECIERIELIKSAQAIGFTLTELKDSLNDYYDGHLDINEQLTVTKQKLAQVKKQQANINRMVELLDQRIAILERMNVEKDGDGNFDSNLDSNLDSTFDIDICKNPLSAVLPTTSTLK